MIDIAPLINTSKLSSLPAKRNIYTGNLIKIEAPKLAKVMKSKKVVIVAVTSNKRPRMLNDLLTAKESTTNIILQVNESSNKK